MKHFMLLTTLFISTTAINAFADPVTYVPYDRWVAIPYCGGYTRLICNGPRQSNQCNIEFRDSYNCPLVDLYSGRDFYPNGNTVTNLPMKGSFYVDNNKIGWFSLSFRTYMHTADNSTRAKLIYQFNY